MQDIKNLYYQKRLLNERYNKLLKKYKPIIETKVQTKIFEVDDRDDIRSLMYLELYKAMKTYRPDHSSKASFDTYAQILMNNLIKRYLSGKVEGLNESTVSDLEETNYTTQVTKLRLFFIEDKKDKGPEESENNLWNARCIVKKELLKEIATPEDIYREQEILMLVRKYVKDGLARKIIKLKTQPSKKLIQSLEDKANNKKESVKGTYKEIRYANAIRVTDKYLAEFLGVSLGTYRASMKRINEAYHLAIK